MSQFAYPAATHGKSALAAGLLAGAILALGCKAGVVATTGKGGGPGPGSGGATGSAGTTGTGGSTGPGIGGVGGTIVTNPDAGSCQQVEYKFEPKIPTVFVLVDRSGSEFTSETAGTYFTLRSAVLQVIQQLQGQVRFGWAAFVGDRAVANGCPTFTSVPTALNNYDAIAAAYNGVGPLLPYGKKADTPAYQALPLVKQALQMDAGTGQKFMLFVTDSESDFCDDGEALCPADAVTWEIQDMWANGMGTLVIGLPTMVSNISAGVLQNFANAGVGQGVTIPSGSGAAAPLNIYYNCNAAGGGEWMATFSKAKRTGMTSIATYSSTAGTASVYSPTSTSQSALYDQIASALADVKSCVFDLTNLQGKMIKVDRNQLGKASVSIMGTAVPLDPGGANGWNMVSDTQLQLFGSACDKWRDPNATTIDFNFPCEIIVE